MTNVATLGIDLAKNVFQLHGVDAHGKAVLRRKVMRDQLPVVLANLPPCLIGMEACGGAHHFAREAQAAGHTVRLMSAQYVKPYVKSQKNDCADAEAICEAVGRPNMRFVPVKTVEQQDVQAIHRVRSQLVKWRTMLTNQARGLAAERGLIARRRAAGFKQALPQWLESARMSPVLGELLADLRERLRELDERIDHLDRQLERIATSDDRMKRLLAIEGIGPLTASALTAAIGDPACFRNGRHVGAWLGLVPRQDSSGGKPRLLGLSKRGDRYLRTLLILLIHGARSAILRCGSRTDSRSRWLQGLMARGGVNKAACALANKNARIAWALLARGQTYRAPS
jgi:transposase